ncbi:pilus assembly protein TadG-related protein [Microbacterium sp. YJN-G]|uniref:pilus assembly protein TadG-related protein n=1 Tax=Microbacterium sp. YJN-G TaxID=2763257 RepID=UPI001878BAF4|nr:pilus assembly protein TadG-related protein [Microbacterium sp. YJN-G]
MRLTRHLRTLAGDEDGSILPLILGYTLLAVAVLFACVCATDLYIAQKRLDSLADAAALAGADGFTLQVDGGDVHAELTDAGVREQADAVVAAVSQDARLVSAGTPDGVSAQVTVSTVWHPPLVSPFVPGGVQIESTATTRTALR